MIGILLLSHGGMAEGMLDSCKLFFGDDIPGVRALCLEAGCNIDDFDAQIGQAIAELDDGAGVVGLVDLMGGTPFNRCALNFRSDRFQVITGMNFTMLLELLGTRDGYEDVSELDIDNLMEVGRNGIMNMNKMFSDM